MTLLESDKNRALGNSNYDEKRQQYEGSRFHITQSIAKHYDSWDEAKIDSRQKKMAAIAAGIWKIDFLD